MCQYCNKKINNKKILDIDNEIETHMEIINQKKTWGYMLYVEIEGQDNDGYKPSQFFQISYCPMCRTKISRRWTKLGRKGGQAMPKEQEVIKRLNFHKEYARLSSNRVVISETDLETVLNMLKEKDKEIEELKQALARNIAKNFTSSMKESEKSKEDLEMLNKGWQIELEKKDKQINLIINAVYKRFKAELLLEYGFENEEQFKQYFERKSEE